jgi:hypothetical protein
MKKLLLLSMFLLGLSFSSFAEQSKESFGIRIEPCSYWRYDFNVNAYTCSSRSYPFSVTEHRDFQKLENIVNALESRVSTLENEIAELKNK